MEYIIAFYFEIFLNGLVPISKYSSFIIVVLEARVIRLLIHKEPQNQVHKDVIIIIYRAVLTCTSLFSGNYASLGESPRECWRH